MKGMVAKLIVRAEECLSDAEYLMKDKRLTVTINRAYYCIFDCVRALLASKNTFAKTHQGVHTKFSELFVKTGIWEFEHASTLKKVFEMRQAGDYDLDEELSEEDATTAIKHAREFLAATKKHFDNQ
jgi:uncharacterized protein (UPF0332 family)